MSHLLKKSQDELVHQKTFTWALKLSLPSLPTETESQHVSTFVCMSPKQCPCVPTAVSSPKKCPPKNSVLPKSVFSPKQGKWFCHTLKNYFLLKGSIHSFTYFVRFDRNKANISTFICSYLLCMEFSRVDIFVHYCGRGI